MSLSLNFLGVPKVLLNGRVVSFPTRKALALLVYLAIEGGTQSRDKITALFWPESDSTQGRTTLRKTLSYLRMALQHTSTHLIADRESLELDLTSDIELDTRVLEAAVRGKSDQIEELVQAAKLYRGDFLEGFSLRDAPEFDDWSSVQREGLHRNAILVFDKLSDVRFARSELTAAIDITMRWIAIDPLDESAYRRLMQLHLANGNRSAALEAFESGRVVLKRELNTEPMLETQKLAERIRETVQSPRLPRPPKSQIDTFRSETPLIGRAEEFKKLAETYHLTQACQLQLVAIEGEPGIGKTKLAREFLVWAFGQGADVLQGGTFKTLSGLPYQPLIEALRERLDNAKDLRKILGDAWLAELSRLLPELRGSLPDLPEPLQTTQAEAQVRLFEAILRGLEAFSHAHPVVLFLDDLQWADISSLEFLQYAVHHWSQHPVSLMLVFTLRSEDLATDSTLRNWMGSLSRNTLFTRLKLGTLLFQDTKQLVQAVSLKDKADTPSNLDEFCRQLYAETGGQPFFVIQTLISLSERGLLQRDQAGGWVTGKSHLIPSGVRELIRGRLAYLEPNALTVCMAGTIIGDGFDFELVCKFANINETDGLSAVEELLARGLLRESNYRYFFTHDRIREVAYSELSEVRRQFLHRRALETLTLPPAELLGHAKAINQSRRVFELALAAGDEAMNLFAVRNAIAYYKQAHEVIDAAPDIAVKFQLHAQLGRAYELVNDWSSAREGYEEMLSLARGKLDLVIEAAALNRIANLILQESFDLGSVLGILRQAQEVAQKSGDKFVLAETQANLAQIHIFTWESHLAIEHADRGLALGRELNTPELVGRGLSAKAYAYLLLGDWEEAKNYGHQAAELYARLHNRALEADSLCVAAEAAISSGKTGEGIAIARTAAGISLEIENRWGQANSAFRLSFGFLEAGNYGEALDAAQKGVELARQLNSSPLLTLNLLALGNIYRALFALAAAPSAHLEAKAVKDLVASHQYADILASELCADYAIAGDWNNALSYARQALAERDYTSLYMNLTRWYETEALCRAGEIEQAAGDLDRLGGRLGKDRRYRIPYLRARAVLAHWQKADHAAIGFLQEAAALAEEMSLPTEEWQARAALSELLRLQGAENNGKVELSQARRIVLALADSINETKTHKIFIAAAQVRNVLKEPK